MRKHFSGEYQSPEIQQFVFEAERGFEGSAATLESPDFEQEIGW